MYMNKGYSCSEYYKRACHYGYEGRCNNYWYGDDYRRNCNKGCHRDYYEPYREPRYANCHREGRCVCCHIKPHNLCDYPPYGNDGYNSEFNLNSLGNYLFEDEMNV